MKELNYLKHILNDFKDVPEDVKKLGEEFLSLQTEEELKSFARRFGIDPDDLDENELKDKVAYELIELYFKKKIYEN